MAVPTGVQPNSFRATSKSPQRLLASRVSHAHTRTAGLCRAATEERAEVEQAQQAPPRESDPGNNGISPELLQKATSAKSQSSGLRTYLPWVGGVLIMTPILQKIFEIVPLDRPLVPALKSNWLLMHVSVMIVGYAALVIGSLGIMVSANDSKVYNNGYKAVGAGYIFLTLGIISGAVWANEAWGTYWSWDPKETWALITWLVYASYLHSGSKWFAAAGLASIFMCFYGFQFLATSLHNY